MTRGDPRDLRHRPAPGGRQRDSLFWQTALPEHDLALQVYLFVTGTGAAGYNVALWGRDGVRALVQGGGRTDADFDDLRVGDLAVAVDGRLTSSTVRLTAPELAVDLAFDALHPAFSFRDNPDGLPSWFADDRIEQTGRVTGTVTVDGETLPLGPLGHRDHSWGLRDWRAPQHWKWLVAYTPSGTAVNAWLWQARGEQGVAGYVLRDGRTIPVAAVDARATYGDGFEQRTLRATVRDVEGRETALELDVIGVLRLPDERSGTIVLEGASVARIDGEAGVGQFETLWPLDYFGHQAGTETA